jgi:aspartyl-tRNA(Asn)/glutamyl-tRNA(Gln) amidotransferase subunit A
MLNRREFVALGVGVAALQAVSSPETSFAAASAAPDELVSLTLSEASKRIQARQVTSVELTRAVLDRIKIYNPKVNKTNMHEFANGATSASTYFGPVRNPWALDRIPA